MNTVIIMVIVFVVGYIAGIITVSLLFRNEEKTKSIKEHEEIIDNLSDSLHKRTKVIEDIEQKIKDVDNDKKDYNETDLINDIKHNIKL